MQQICLVIPIREGMSDDGRAFMRELEDERKEAYDLSERRIGIEKEAWFLAASPEADRFVAYMETPDFAHALSLFSQSQDDFDLWFKRRLRDSTGLDLNDPPEMTLPELLSSYAVGVPTSA